MLGTDLERIELDRLAIISETVSPRRTPSPAKPAATLRTCSAYCRQVRVWVSPGVRSATASGSIEAVRWKASHNVAGRSDVLMIHNLGTHTVQMDGSPESHHPHERLTRRAEELAFGAERYVPSWLRAGEPESALPVLLALLSAMVLQVVIPKSYTLVPRWPLLVMEALLLVVLLVINPLTVTRRTRMGRYAAFVLLAAITIDNTLSAVLLDVRIVSGRGQQRRRGAAGQRRSDLHHEHHRVRHLVLGTRPRRPVRPARTANDRIPTSCFRR